MTALFQSWGLTHDWAWGLATLAGILIIAVPLLATFGFWLAWGVAFAVAGEVAAGVLAAVATEKHVPEVRIKDSSVIIQGFGNVGSYAAALMAASARVAAPSLVLALSM